MTDRVVRTRYPLTLFRESHADGADIIMLRRMPLMMTPTFRTATRVLSAPVSQAFDGASAEAYETIFESLVPAWKKHADIISNYAGSDGDISILDIGAGPGEPSCTIAAALPKAKITCTDVSEDMISKAKTRAENKGVQLSLGVCPGEDLSQFPDASFDYITMNFSLMFVPDREKCLDECVRVLKPGGKVLSMCWKTNAFMAAIGKATAEFTGEPPGVPPPVNPMALKAENAQEDLAKGAGLEVMLAEEMNVPILAKNEAIFRACSLIVMGPKLQAMEAEGRVGATKEFQDLFVQLAPSVPGITIDQGAYAFNGMAQVCVMGKP